MAERAESMGAALTVESEPGVGTEVTVIWEEDDGDEQI
jgi:signal transduction histidine kinase